jgi:aspartyl protease family protein
MRYFVILLILGGLAALLNMRFPYALKGDGDMGHLIYVMGLIALIAGGGWASGRWFVAEAVKYGLIWFVIVMVLVLGYSHRDNLSWKRIKAELFPNQLQMTMGGGMSVQASADGHFHIEAEVNNALVDFIVDTGASDIVLSPSDAQRVGFVLDMLDYTRLYNTANGTGAGAPVTINSIKVGYAVFQRVPASVNNAPMNHSLLGMSFLRQFKSYYVDGDTLTLYP